MSDELNFNELSLNDVTVGGKPIVEAAPEQAPVEAKTEPAAEEQTPVETALEQKVEAPVDEEVSGRARQAVPKYEFKDDFIKGAVEYYEKTGDLTPYLQAKTVDFSTMDDAAVMRRNLREQYPDVSEKAFDRLFQQQVVDKFKLDPEQWGEDDVELGKELLRSEAQKLRTQYMDWQKKFVAPEPQANPEAEAQETAMQEAIAQFEKSVSENSLTRSILEAKRLSIKTGDDEFNYELQNPQDMVEMTLDNNKFFQQFASGENQLDYSKWYKTVAYSQNPEQFERALINFGKTLGRSEVTKEIKNPSTAPVGDVPTESSGDFTSGLLQAFASRGISK
jgi:hypothetical protein